ncbi:hypothetical protein LLG95_17725 [bacterium]|nr:hypothetical protein [bacterium]
MVKQKLNLESLEDEIDRLRRQLEEREAIKAEFSELYRQRQIVVELREKLMNLKVPDSIDEREDMERAVDDGVEAIATAHHKLFPPEHRKPVDSRSRRSSVDPEVMKQKEEFYFRRQAKINAGLIDSNGRPKKRLTSDEHKKYEHALKKLKDSGWTPPELIKARQRGTK